MADASILDGKKVLIVDDEPDILESLHDLLSMCVVTRASTFEEAKRILETQDLDLGIFDIMGVDGYKLLDIANEKKILPIMLTAHVLSPEETAKSYNKGAAFFVPKEEMVNITIFIRDVLEAKEKGENYWATWLDRLGPFYEKRFGPDWKDSEKEFWEDLAKRDWRLASVLRREEECE